MNTYCRRVGALAPIALVFSLTSSQASAAQQAKIPHPPPAMQDIKTPPPLLPPKPAAPAREPIALERVLEQQQAKLPAPLAGARPNIDPNAVYFDQPGDGSVWTMGRVYKAQFSAGGASYIPNFGPKAPQNYPLTFQVTDAAVGGAAIDLVAGASASRVGDAVQYERGGLTELYQIRAEAVEQEFVFRTLPASGELVVHLSVASELAASESPEGFRFSNDLGYVSYGRAVAIDAAGHHIDAQTTLAGNTIEIRVPAAFVSDAVLPLTIDPVITTFSINTSTSLDFSPDVAYDVTTARYLVCWEREYSSTDHDVWAEQYNTAGTLVASSGDYIDFTGDFWATPRVANNNIGDNYLVVARVGTASPRVIKGRTRDDNSTTMGAQFTISNTPAYDCISPDVGGDPVTTGPTYYLVVWRRVFISGTDDDVHGQLVTSGGALSGTTIFIDNSSSTVDTDPNVSKSDGLEPFGTQEWTVTWTREFTPGVDYDIWGSQVHWDGTITHPTYQIDFSGAYDYNSNPSTVIDGASGERDYMVVYQRFDSGSSDRDIHGAIYNGTTYVDDANLSALDTNTGQQQINPTVDSDGCNYAVAYSEQFGTSTFDYDMYVSTFTRVGSNIHCSEAHELLDFSSTQDNAPQIAARHGSLGSTSQSMVVWQNEFTGGTDYNITGGIYETEEFTTFCFPGIDAISCPCGNPPASAGRGCNNSSNTGGAILTKSGNADLSSDSLVFTATGEKPTATSIFLQGTTATSGASFGQGVRCASGTLKRLYTKTAVAGVVTAPQGGDPDVSVRSAALGDTIGAGETRYYLVYYRDPTVLGGCAATRTFNATQTGAVGWVP